MNVLHVIPDLAPEMGGPVKAVLGMAQALSEAGVNVRLLTTDHGWTDPDGHRGFEIRVCPCRFCPWRLSPRLA